MCFCFTRYLPRNVTLFNAYAIHGTKWGEASPSEEDKRYEALYQADRREDKGEEMALLVRRQHQGALRGRGT